MQRYFVTKENEQTIFLQKEDIHHIKKVMRNKNGDSIICIDNNQHSYLCSIEDIETGQVKIVEQLQEQTELDVKVTLIYAMPKGDKFEFVLQKATELGVHAIVPMITSRCVVKLDKEKFEKKKQRYQKIMKEAAEQSYRLSLPTIHSVQTIDTIDEYLSTHNLVAYEETAKIHEHGAFQEVLSNIQPNDSITIIVGSEGGFDEGEIEKLEKKGVRRCSLGNRILRSETAPLYMLSVIGFAREVQK